MPTLNDLNDTVEKLRGQVNAVEKATELNTQALEFHSAQSAERHKEVLEHFKRVEARMDASDEKEKDKNDVRVPRKIIFGLIGFLILATLVGGKAAVEAMIKSINPAADAHSISQAYARDAASTADTDKDTD